MGVVVSVHVNLSQAEADALSEAAGKALRDKLIVDVIAGREASRRLPPGGVPEGCGINPACVHDLAQRLSADQLLMMVAVKVGRHVQIDTTWIDPATMKTASRPAVVLERLDQAPARFAAAATGLMPDAAVRPPEPVQVRVPVQFPVPVGPTLVRRPRRMTRAAWITAAVGGATLVGAVGFTLAARSDYQDLQDSHCVDTDTCSEARRDTLGHKDLAADLLWGATAASAITVSVLYYLSGGQEEVVPPSRTIQIGPGPGATLGLSVRGSL